MSEFEDPRLTLGREPIPGAVPAGENLRYEPEFEAVEAEVKKMDLGGSAAVDWKMVARECETLLKDRSKDLLLAAYLTYALHRQEGFKGLAAGLGITAGLVEVFWDDMQPPARRERARVGIIDWIAEKVAPEIEQAEPTGQSLQDARAAFGFLDALDRALSDKLKKESASITPLLRPLRDLNRQAEQEEKAAAEKAAKDAAAGAQQAENAQAEPATAPESAPDPAPAPAAQPAAAAAPPSAPVEIDSADLKKAVKQISQPMIKLAKSLRETDATDARAYSLLREAVWLPIKDAPLSEGGITPLPDPEADQVKLLAGYAESGRFADLVKTAETVLPDRPFWLDLQHYSAMALENLGQPYASAHQGVLNATAAFVGRLPQLLTLSFSGGTPFADDQTKMWLDTEVMAVAEGGGTGGGDAFAGKLAEAEAAARKLGAKGNKAEAADLFMDVRAEAGDERDRFRADLALARFCAGAGMGDVAEPMLRHLAERAERLSMENWEPALAVEIYQPLYRLVKARLPKEAKADDPTRADLDALWSRLCRLSIPAALAAKA